MSSSSCGSSSVSEAWLPVGFCASVFARDVREARGMVVDVRDGGLLVVERGESRILALYDLDGDGYAEERRIVASAPGLNHGIALGNGFLYASRDTEVYRWRYDAGSSGEDRTTVVSGIPEGGHQTRTLLLDGNFLFVSVGSMDNVDKDSSRSRVKL